MKNILDFMTTKFKTYDLFELCGIPIKLNISFFLLGILVLLGSGCNVCMSLVALLVLFVSLTSHELGHCIMAKKFGYSTNDITITALGGCAAMDIYSRPGSMLSADEELKIAIAGPCVSFVLGICSFICLATILVLGSAASSFSFVAAVLYPVATFFAGMVCVNFVIGLFNLIPAFPMDGGRVLRAWLSKKRSRIAATEIAIKTAKAIACIFVFLAVLLVLTGNIGGLTLGLVAMFIWNAGEMELEFEKRMLSMYSKP